MVRYLSEKTYFYINGHDFRIDTDASTESEINLVKTRMHVPDKAWGYNDIQWTNFSGENIELTIYSRVTDRYTGEHAQPDNGGITDFYETDRTPHAVLKYWSQNFVPCNVKTNLQAFESGRYVIETLKQSQPTFDFIITDMTLIQYEPTEEVNQSYFTPSEYLTNTSALTASVAEVGNLSLHSQTCDCNEFTPALQCTAPVEEDVKIIQKYLQDWGYFPTYTNETKKIEPNGRYCYNTTVGVKKFQEAEGIPITGDFTEETCNHFVKKIMEE